MKPLLLPLLLIADPRITARMRSSSAIAWESRFSTSTPPPSLRTKPSALASPNLQVPSRDSMPARPKAWVISGRTMALIPATKATSQVLARKCGNGLVKRDER